MARPTLAQAMLTRPQLIQAAAFEFNENGYDATDTNRIARRAGFAPQTFYRQFADKRAIFIAVYLDWVATEQDLLAGVRDAVEAATILSGHHRQYRIFRRSLRQLSLSDEAVRQIRRESRAQQIKLFIQRFPTLADRPFELLAVRLLTIERIADAIAEDELADLGVSSDAAQALLAKEIVRFLSGE